VAAAPAAAMVDLLPAADNPHICPGKSLVSGLCAVPLPSSGRTLLAVRLTVGDPRLLARFWPENWQALRACLPGNPHVPHEIRVGYQNNITSRMLRGDSRLVCNWESISLGFALIRGPGPASLPVTGIVR